MSAVEQVFLDDDSLKPQTIAHHLARYEFAKNLKLGGKALDVMCGSGYGCQLLAEGGFEVEGIDSNQKAIRFALLNYPDPFFSFMPVQKAYFPEDNYDLITWFEGIEHIDYQDATDLFHKLFNSLKKGGKLVLSTPRDLNQKYNQYHKSLWQYNQLNAFFNSYFPEYVSYGQDWDTAVIDLDKPEENDFYIFVGIK